MTKSFLKKSTIFMFNLPTPKSISFFWSVGSLLGFILFLQILTGIFLSFYYVSGMSAWNSIIILIRESFFGWMIRCLHFNGASLVFFFIFVHYFRGILQSSFFLKKTWMTGWILLFLMMSSAFLGYVLPWGQMSLWGATVIINLLSVFPNGKPLVNWLWGGYYVSNFTCSFFFSLHFLIPLISMMFIVIHLLMLHETGSNSPINLNSDLIKTKFSVLFTIKDLMNFIMLMVFFLFLFSFPFSTNDPVNFSMSDLTNSPIHIQPEWYFLHFYAILRSIPNKLGGVILFALALILILLPLFSKSFMKPSQFFFWNYFSFSFILTNMFLMWLGSKPVETPFILISQIYSCIYFCFLFMILFIDWLFIYLFM